MKPIIALSATLLLAAHLYAASVETVDFQPDNIPAQAVLKRHSHGYSLAVTQKQPRRTLLHIRDFLPGNVSVAKLNALYGSFSARSHTEDNNFADIALRVENGRPRIASLTCHLPALSGKTMPEYDSDHNTLQLISLMEYDRDRQTLEITTTHDNALHRQYTGHERDGGISAARTACRRFGRQTQSARNMRSVSEYCAGFVVHLSI